MHRTVVISITLCRHLSACVRLCAPEIRYDTQNTDLFLINFFFTSFRSHSSVCVTRARKR